MAERQSARMSKITNDGLTRSGTKCFIVVPIWQQWALTTFNNLYIFRKSTLFSQVRSHFNCSQHFCTHLAERWHVAFNRITAISYRYYITFDTLGCERHSRDNLPSQFIVDIGREKKREPRTMTGSCRPVVQARLSVERLTLLILIWFAKTNLLWTVTVVSHSYISLKPTMTKRIAVTTEEIRLVKYTVKSQIEIKV